MADLGLRPGEVLHFAIRGECMPGMRGAGTVAVRKQRFYVPGDVVVVRRNNHWDAHRFLGYAPSIRGPLALTQADDALACDPPSRAAAILGRVQCEVTTAQRVTSLRRFARAVFDRIIGERR